MNINGVLNEMDREVAVARLKLLLKHQGTDKNTKFTGLLSSKFKPVNT
jgi:hypothetical protein